MIRKGTRGSRVAALGIALGPVVLGVGAFAIWAVSAWGDATSRIRAAEVALHEIDARRSQAEFYGPLGESWEEYAASDSSGLLIEPDSRSAAKAVISRVEALFKRFDQGSGVANLIDIEEQKSGLEVVRVEAWGRLREADLPTFFDSLEAPEPFLFVEALDVRRAPNSGAGATVELRLRVAGFRMKGGLQ